MPVPAVGYQWQCQWHLPMAAPQSPLANSESSLTRLGRPQAEGLLALGASKPTESVVPLAAPLPVACIGNNRLAAASLSGADSLSLRSVLPYNPLASESTIMMMPA